MKLERKCLRKKKGENHPFYGKKHSEETKIKMSAANTHRVGKTHSLETISKMSTVKKGENNPMFGRKHSDEARKKMSEIKLGRARPCGAGSPAKKIEVFNNKDNSTTIYDSIGAAAIALAIGKSVISKYLARNDQKLYKGQYTFKKL